MSKISDPATTLDCLIAKAGQLYSLPAVAMEVLDLTNNPQVDTRALKECIENDPALTGKLLRVVNSSLFGLSREVSDLNQALALLGTKPLKLLVLGFSLPAGLFADVPTADGSGEILGRYWRHTLTKAVAGREISEALFDAPGDSHIADEAFIAGLLQDLGMLLLIQELGEPYARFLDKVAHCSKNLAALETESMGFEHTEVTARLLAAWGLPDLLVKAVNWDTSDEPLEEVLTPAAGPSEKVLPQILRLAELFARLLADEQPEALGELLEAGRRYAGLTKDRIEMLVSDLGEKVAQLADVLSLQLPGGLDYRDVLVRAHGQLADVAASAAGDLVAASDGPCSKNGAGSSEGASALAEIQILADAVAAVSQERGRESFSGSTQRALQEKDSRDLSSPDRSRLTSVPADAGPVPFIDGVSPHAPPAPTPTRTPVSSAVATADPGLLGRLEVAVAGCRQSRCPLSLLLVQLDDGHGNSNVDELMITRGVEGFYHLRQLLGSLCADMGHTDATCVAHGETGFALILPDCERRQALELGNRLIEAVRRLAPAGAAARAPSLGAGVATVALPPKNFPAEELFSGAERCLYGSSASGGGVVKSIEIY